MREEGLERMRDCKVRGDLWVSRLSAEHEADMMGGEKKMQYSGDRRREEEKRSERRVAIRDGRLAVDDEERKEEEEKKEERERDNCWGSSTPYPHAGPRPVLFVSCGYSRLSDAHCKMGRR
jgi:hypothetical protein